MRALIDTNIILDALMAREPFCKDAEAIMLAIAAEELDGWITANSITDIVYVLRKAVTPETLKQAMRDMLEVLPVVGLTGLDCWGSLDLDEGDFEDAVLIRCALTHDFDYIVSRDEALLKRKVANLQIVKPSVVLAQMQVSFT